MHQPGETDTNSCATARREVRLDAPACTHAVSGTGRAISRVFAVVIVCGTLAATTAGCAAPEGDAIEYASTSGDFAVGMAGGGSAEASGFLGTGMEGATGPVNFADGTSGTVVLGPKYFAASGRWCRHYQPLGSEGDQTVMASTEVACAAGTSWNRVRPVVVTRFSNESRS